MKKFIVIFLILFCTAFSISAQQRGGDYEEGAVEIVDGRKSFNSVGKQWAIFIAIDNYREWEPLKHPVKDAQEIKNILMEHYYIDYVRELYNTKATVSEIRRLFIELQEKTAPNDSVFVFHAGHGFNDEKTKTTGWIPHDGGEDYFLQQSWLTHLQIRSMLDSLSAKHVFLISDSCFSGDLLVSLRGGEPGTVISYPAAYDRVSRQAMSSGASELVSDASEFASRLKNTLLRTETPYLTPDYLLSQIKEVHTVKPLYTIPILAAMPDSLHQLGGSFLFFRKNARLPLMEITSTQETTTTNITSGQTSSGLSAESAYFVGSWVAMPDNMSSDTYYINLLSNGRCTVKLTNGIAEQETSGFWSYDGSMFKLDATFINPPISYQRSIHWLFIVKFVGNNSFNILGKAETNGSNVLITFFRD